MTKSRDLGRGFRSDKAPNPAVANVSTSVDSITPTAPAPAPGSAEIIAEIAAKLLALDPSTFKTGQMYDTASENLRVALSHHKDIQAAQVTAQSAARLDEVPALTEAITALTKENATAKETISLLKDRINRLEPRVASADAWDAQVSRLAAEAKAAEAKAKADKIIADENRKIAREINQIKSRLAEFDEIEKPSGAGLHFIGQSGPPHISECQRQRNIEREALGHRLDILEGRVTPAQEAKRKSDIFTKALWDERTASPVGVERDPSERRYDGPANILRNLDTGEPVR